MTSNVLGTFIHLPNVCYIAGNPFKNKYTPSAKWNS
jgi:hypothetical protein